VRGGGRAERRAEHAIDGTAAATPAELDYLRSGAERMGLTVDPEIYELLSTANGTGFDSFLFYGAGIDRADDLGRLDLILANELIEERGNDTLYGQWQDEFFVFVAAAARFERQSIVTGDTYAEYATCAQMLVALFSEELDLLEEAAGVNRTGDG